jgi:hypothetical protein
VQKRFHATCLQNYKHAAHVIEGARDGNFCCRIVKVEAAQMIHVGEQILAARKVPLQFSGAKAIEPERGYE